MMVLNPWTITWVSFSHSPLKCVVWFGIMCVILHRTALLSTAMVVVVFKCVSVVVVQLFTIIFHCRLFCLSLSTNRIYVFLFFTLRLKHRGVWATAANETHRQKIWHNKIRSIQMLTSMHDVGNGITNALLSFDPSFVAVSIFPTSSTEK